MRNSDRIESRMIERAIQRGQSRLASRGDLEFDADSAEEWFCKFWEATGP